MTGPDDSRPAAALAHADQVFANAESKVVDLVARMDKMRADDPDCARVDQWLPLLIAMKDVAPEVDNLCAFLAVAVLRLSEAGQR